MISWTDAAIEAALESYYGANWRGRFQETNNERKNEMRAALDAAVKAQGVRQTDLHALFGYEAGRADALEEAARVADEQADECDSRYPSDTARMIAAAIRALREKKGVT